MDSGASGEASVLLHAGPTGDTFTGRMRADALGPPACLLFVSHSWWLYGPHCSLTGLIKSVARSLYKQSELKKDERNKLIF